MNNNRSLIIFIVVIIILIVIFIIYDYFTNLNPPLTWEEMNNCLKQAHFLRVNQKEEYACVKSFDITLRLPNNEIVDGNIVFDHFDNQTNKIRINFYSNGSLKRKNMSRIFYKAKDGTFVEVTLRQQSKIHNIYYDKQVYDIILPYKSQISIPIEPINEPDDNLPQNPSEPDDNPSIPAQPGDDPNDNPSLPGDNPHDHPSIPARPGDRPDNNHPKLPTVPANIKNPMNDPSFVAALERCQSNKSFMLYYRKNRQYQCVTRFKWNPLINRTDKDEIGYVEFKQFGVPLNDPGPRFVHILYSPIGKQTTQTINHIFYKDKNNEIIEMHLREGDVVKSAMIENVEVDIYLPTKQETLHLSR